MSFLLAEGGGGMTPVLIPCSRSAHDQNVLARRPQWDPHGCHSWEGETSKLGRVNLMSDALFDARSQGQPRPPPPREHEEFGRPS